MKPDATSSFVASAAVAIAVAASFAPLPADAALTCGPHAVTYEVQDAPNHPAGVRCVKFVDRHSFVWYGEGHWGGAVYRHLGYAIERSVDQGDATIFQGFAADFTGNGENTNGAYPGSLRIAAAPGSWAPANGPSFIDVSGAWHERWLMSPFLERTTQAIAPLGPVRSCGPNMRQFGVAQPSPDAPDDPNLRVDAAGGGGGGIRCLLDADGKFPAAWFGEGFWGRSTYRHIGTGSFDILGTRWGAVDLCAPGTICGEVPFGGLDLRFVPGNRDAVSIRVHRAWDEWWDRSR